MTDATWRCKCSAVEISVTSGKGGRVVCYCSSCREFARHLEADGVLDASGGSDIYSTVPARVKVVKGAEHLKALRMTEKGPVRFYAGCCNTPLANVLSTDSFPFLSLILNDGVEREGFGPVRHVVNTARATGPVIEGKPGTLGFALALLRRGVSERLAGRRASPFFGSDRRPIAEAPVLPAVGKSG